MIVDSEELSAVQAIVPLQILEKSKTRLSSILCPLERAQLTIAMVKDVFAALTESRMVDSVTVVSADRKVLALVQQIGAEPFFEEPRRGLNNAIIQVIRKRKWEKAAVLVVHADLPLLTSREVTTFIRNAQGYSVALAPSRNETGTNAIILNPARIIRPAFGKESYRRHIAMMNRKRIRFKVERSQGFGFDVDEPKDLSELIRHGARNCTAEFLRALCDRKPQIIGYQCQVQEPAMSVS